ncbi:MAG: mono/diheme cytochrome c family protein/glucose/arabinose dehydrogenase [Planctomycetota bacterium]|jgi:mono/diheme cytochrome c family protein/glucose/arabinose dehydrogenase
MRRTYWIQQCFSILTLASAASAQNGDRPNEEQPSLPADLVIPAAPALTPQEALDSFVLAPGFKIELVASEPLVVDPVCMAFDGDGRIWVAEMLAYMPNVDGTGEEEPIGRIAVLSDTDGDGAYDQRVTFLDGLVLPRAVLPYRDGALVISPPELAFHRDTDGDGKADTKLVIARGLGGISSPEHAINALRWTHDNWVQCARTGVRFKETGEGWITQALNGGGQWGLAFDEEGRAFFNTNSDALRGDTFSSHYAVRNSNFGRAGGMNVRFAEDQSTWPARITPGVNRGYREETLRDDFTLRNLTGACGPLVYLGAAFPQEMHGNAFIAEPCGNLVKRFTLHPKGDWGISARNAYEGREFLTSTDERFRPVNLYDGPDGALYVVDLYRGVLQHRLFVTSWLRKQIESRGLETPLGLGRIWRVVHEDSAPQAAKKLGDATWTELVQELDHPNGMRRLLAQRLIVEDGAEDGDAIDLCRESLREAKTGLGRLHSLWALQGIAGLDQASALLGLRDSDLRVVRAALRASEGLLATGNDDVLDEYRVISASADMRTKRQLLFSLGEANTDAADDLMADLLVADCSNKEIRSAVLSGLMRRELPFLLGLFERSEWLEEKPGRKELVRDLARCITRETQHASIERLLMLVVQTVRADAESLGWRSKALIQGALDGRSKNGKGELRPVRMAREPEQLGDLRSLAELEFAEPVQELLLGLTWPGDPNGTTEEVRALTELEQASFERGRQIYGEICTACHQSSGKGQAGVAPPLRYSSWLVQDEETPIRILLGGLEGPIQVDGKDWNMEMPVYDSSASDVAAVLTYVRREWGHTSDPVSAQDVEAIAKELAARGSVWTAAELKAAQDE